MVNSIPINGCLIEKLMEGEIHIWNYNLDVDKKTEDSYASILTKDEFDRASRFKFIKHRRRYISRRGILRTILANYANTNPESITFETSVNGKPHIKLPVSARDIRFSASVSQGLGGVAVTCTKELGFDLEKVQSNIDFENIAENEFSRDEKDWLFSLSRELQLVAFYKLWTSKEAYLKGKGIGLTVPLNGFSMSIDQNRQCKLDWSSIDNKDVSDWTFQYITVAPEYEAHLAVYGKCNVLRIGRWPDM